MYKASPALVIFHLYRNGKVKEQFKFKIMKNLKESLTSVYYVFVTKLSPQIMFL